MHATANRQIGLDGQAVSDGPSTGAPSDGTEAGAGGSPFLTLNGFSGPLDHLLMLARAQKIDIAAISLTALLDQLTTALHHAPATTALGEKGDWVVMAAWLVQLRTRLLLPADTSSQQAATAEADQLRERLVALEEVQALAGWLERRPQLGRDVFARGRPELLGISVEAGPAIDVTEFLWASLALFDDDLPSDETTVRYRPRWWDLHAVPEARARILRLLAETPDGRNLDTLLPEAAGADAEPILRQRSAWSSTFIASLELAKQGDVALAQEAFLSPIQVRITSTGQSQRVSDRNSRAC